MNRLVVGDPEQDPPPKSVGKRSHGRTETLAGDGLLALDEESLAFIDQAPQRHLVEVGHGKAAEARLGHRHRMPGVPKLKVHTRPCSPLLRATGGSEAQLERRALPSRPNGDWVTVRVG